MDINAFYTTQAGNNTTKGAAATQALVVKACSHPDLPVPASWI